MTAAGALDGAANDVNMEGLTPDQWFGSLRNPEGIPWNTQHGSADIVGDSGYDGGNNGIGANNNVDDEIDAANAAGYIVYAGHAASLQGTGGVALLEYAKDAIQTAVSNISGTGTNLITARKNVERKMGNLG